MPPIARYLLGLVILVGISTSAARLEAQQARETQPAPSQSIRTHPANAELVGRFQLLKEEYATIKARTAKYVALRPTHPPAVLQTRSQLSSSLLAYDRAEREIQASLDTASELGEAESLRLQMAMDRQSKLMQEISNIMKKLSDTGDSIVQNVK
jgi:hypothetical protein